MDNLDTPRYRHSCSSGLPRGVIAHLTPKVQDVNYEGVNKILGGHYDEKDFSKRDPNSFMYGRFALPQWLWAMH